MSKAKFAAAKKLIMARKYAEARAILKTINHPTARQWEAKLDALETDKPTPRKSKPSPRRNFVRLLLVGSSILCIALYLIGSNPELQKAYRATQTARAIAQAATDDARRILSTLVTYTPSPTITDTPIPSKTFTPIPTATIPPQVTTVPSRTYYVTRNANARSCPNTTCDILGQFAFGQSVNVDGITNGAVVSGSSDWYRIGYQGATAYIHSSLVSPTRPAQPTQPPSSIQSQPSGSSGNSSGSSGTSCGGATTCGEMSSCAQAYACLAAGRGSLDRDKDGIPCEDICGG